MASTQWAGEGRRVSGFPKDEQELRQLLLYSFVLQLPAAALLCSQHAEAPPVAVHKCHSLGRT